MGNQTSKVIDITKTYIPVDPESFPTNMGFTGKEDSPTEEEVVSAFEGYNFMPTSYGYRSYFGVNSTLEGTPLLSRVDDIFLVQSADFSNYIIALCEDGIWMRAGESATGWEQLAIVTPPELGYTNRWTKAIISNTVYCYQAGLPFYYKMEFEESIGIPPLNPSAVTGLTAIRGIGGVNSFEPHYYSIAYKDGTGLLSEPSSEVGVTFILGNASCTVAWDKLAGATSYRIYRRKGSVVTYRDVPQPVGSAASFPDTNTGWLAITLPDVNTTEVSRGVFRPVTVVPTFLNMEGQEGIFRAGGRLAFWDTEGSIAWSSIDDFANFTPDLESLAGNAIFSDVQGRVTTILGHGSGFIIYSTKSIVLIRQDFATGSQWTGSPILSTAGVAFHPEVTAGLPDTTHYAWTPVGLYEITRGEPKILVPAVTDFLKESNDPIFLQLLEGRYLTLGILDAGYINGKVKVRGNRTAGGSYIIEGPDTIPGKIIPMETLKGEDFCTQVDKESKGETDEQQDQAEADRAAANAAAPGSAPPKKEKTKYRPKWTCWISQPAPISGEIEWSAAPVATIMANEDDGLMCPGGTLGQTANATQDRTNKRQVEGDDAYVQGGWTMERFAAVQNAIWEADEQARDSFNEKIKARAKQDTKTSAAASPVNVTPTHEEATIGRYIKSAKGRHFGYTQCSFWLTRYITEAFDLIRVRSYSAQSTVPADRTTVPLFSMTGPVWTATSIAVMTPLLNTTREEIALAVIAKRQAGAALDYPNDTAGLARQATIAFTRYIPANIPGAGEYTLGIEASIEGYDYPVGVASAQVVASCPAGYAFNVATGLCELPGSYENTEKVSAYNKGRDATITPIPDVGFCSITGWEYTTAAGGTKTVPASSCTQEPSTSNGGAGQSKPPGANGNNVGGKSINGKPITDPIDGEDGEFCSMPFEPIIIPAISIDPIVWPVQEPVVFPPTTFLTQKGSVGPLYATIEGSLVYDLHLKKWGKMKQAHKRLLDFSPLNTSTGAIINYDVFGVQAGALLGDGTIALFDKFPLDSYIRYGKIGYYRRGVTQTEEVHVNFRSPAAGSVAVQGSMDGRSLDASQSLIQSYDGVLSIKMFGTTVGQWHTVTIRGQYDIINIEYRGQTRGRR